MGNDQNSRLAKFHMQIIVKVGEIIDIIFICYKCRIDIVLCQFILKKSQSVTKRMRTPCKSESRLSFGQFLTQIRGRLISETVDWKKNNCKISALTFLK